MHFRGTSETGGWGLGDPQLPNDPLPRQYQAAPYSKASLLLATYFLFQSDGNTFRKCLVDTETKVYYFSFINVTIKVNKALVTLKVSQSTDVMIQYNK